MPGRQGLQTMSGDLSTDIHDAAAVWAERLLAKGQLDRSVQLRLEAWLEADPRHQAALNTCLELEGMMNAARGSRWAEALIAEAEADLAPQIAPTSQRSWTRHAAWAAPVAGLAAALLLALSWPVWNGLIAPRQADDAGQVQSMTSATYSTRRGETLEVALEDGSVIELNTGSRVTTEFTANERRVVLHDGEALFDVAHDPQRPFTVSAGGHEVRAVGTAFSVYARGDGRTVVTVVEGLVQMRAEESGFSAALLRAGEQVELAAGEPAPEPHRVDTQVATSWTEGWLIFADRPLADVVAEFRRYVDLHVEFAQDGLGDLRISGNFEPSDTDAFLAALESTGRVRLEREGDRVVIEPAGPAANGEPG